MIRPERLLPVLIPAALLALAGGCSDEVTGPTEDIESLANVQDVSATVFSDRVEVVASGNLPDTCTSIAEIDVDRVDEVFTVSIATRRPGDVVCAQVLVPFSETIVLETDDLPPGDYRVVVNGVIEDFTLPRR